MDLQSIIDESEKIVFFGGAGVSTESGIPDFLAEKAPSADEKDLESMSEKELNKLVKEIQRKMHQAAAELNFEEAAVLRDRMLEVKKALLDLEA